jgi:hypothetical protein
LKKGDFTLRKLSFQMMRWELGKVLGLRLDMEKNKISMDMKIS